MLKRFLPICAIFLAFGSTKAEPHFPAIKITAKRFEFSPSEITVHKGQPVTLVITSTDVSHGFLIKELNVLAEVKKGSPARVTFEPHEGGDFVAECAHFCGTGHGRMHLVVHVRD
jgi:cytochrome c oxidase subunit II